MSDYRLCPMAEYLPEGQPQGCVLTVSDYRPLNLGHATTLCMHGYAVCTAVTCTDVPRVYEMHAICHLDLVAFASLVHGWHHREGERRPASIPQTTDPEWQIRNMREVIDLVCQRQTRPPTVLIAVELMTFGWYRITRDALEAAGIEHQTYPASDPHAIVDFLRVPGARGRVASGASDPCDGRPYLRQPTGLLQKRLPAGGGEAEGVSPIG